MLGQTEKNLKMQKEKIKKTLKYFWFVKNLPNIQSVMLK